MLKAAYGFSSFCHKAEHSLSHCCAFVAHGKLSCILQCLRLGEAGAAKGRQLQAPWQTSPLCFLCAAVGQQLGCDAALLWVCSLLVPCSAFGMAFGLQAGCAACGQLCSSAATRRRPPLFLLDELCGDVCSGLRLKQGAIKRRLTSKEESGRRPGGTLPSSFSFHRRRKSPKLWALLHQE